MRKTRAQKRQEAAEEVCIAFRKALSYAATEHYWMNVALQWLLVWLDNTPDRVKNREPRLPKRRRSL